MLKRIDFILIVSLVIYLYLLLPYINEYPFLDASIHFQQAHDLYTGGFQKFFEKWYETIHPPAKQIALAILFYLFGVNSFTNTLLGITSGIVGIISIYKLTATLHNKQSARLSALLLSTSPLFISNSLFAQGDFLICVLIIIAYLCYLKQKYYLYTLTSTIAILTKETALMYPISVLLTELLYAFQLKKGIGIKKGIIFIIPFISFLIWSIFLKVNGQHHWSDNIYADTAGSGSFVTVVMIFLTGSMFNIFLYNNLKQLFLLNFSYVFWIILFIGFLSVVNNSKLKNTVTHEIINTTSKSKTLINMIAFTLLYIIGVLSFPTLSIPRYALPLLPFLIVFTSITLTISLIGKITKLTAYFFLTIIIILSLFSSVDPVSEILWGKTNIFNENIYNLDPKISGHNSITYNYQFLTITHARNNHLKKYGGNSKILSKKECKITYIVPSTDHGTRSIFGINANVKKC